MYVAAIDESCYIADDAAVIGNITIKKTAVSGIMQPFVL